MLKQKLEFDGLPLLFLTSINPFCLILCKKSLPKRPSIPLSRLNRPDILTTIWMSLYFEAYKRTTFPPATKIQVNWRLPYVPSQGNVFKELIYVFNKLHKLQNCTLYYRLTSAEWARIKTFTVPNYCGHCMFLSMEILNNST